MYRSLKLPFLVLVACLHVTFAYAADPSAGTAPPQEPATLAAVQEGPVVQLAKTSFNFGEVSEGKDYVHDFKIKNVGKAELQIKKVLPG